LFSRSSRPLLDESADSEPVTNESITSEQLAQEPITAARGGSRQGPRHRKPKSPRPFWIEAVVLIAFALGIALAVHTFFLQAFFIPSGSMENTLHVGDRVLVNRMSYKVGHVQRGQIIVFNGEDSWTAEAPSSTPSNPVSRVLHDVGGFLGFAPAGEKDFIKRVIGIPGDHVVCCDSQGRIMINGTPLDENYLSSGIPVAVSTTTKVNAARPFDITVPPGRVWVEGDHRDDSADSRSHTADPGGGTIPESKIIGRAFVIVWPLSHWRGLSIPASYRPISNAAAIAMPYGIGAIMMAPIGLLRWRRRRRARRDGRLKIADPTKVG
jgi:signal peptidase I